MNPNTKTLSTILTLLIALTPALAAVEQYKQITRDEISNIVDGKLDKAIANLDKYLIEHPDDLESMFGLAVAYAQRKDIAQAMDYVQRAVDAGLPFGRFLAGPRDLLGPLTAGDQFKKYAKRHDIQLLHGPLLGCVTENSAKLWIRTAQPVTAQARISLSPNLSAATTSKTVITADAKDYTAILPLTDLKPNTTYHYQLIIDGKEHPQRFSFRTFPPAGKKAKFDIGFGGGAGYTPMYEHMWNTINDHNPLAFLLLGDNIYIDNPTRPAVQNYCYYRRQSRPEYRLFAASTSVFAIWDDHDFTTNDSQGGPEINVPAWKIPVWQLFKNNWNNPYYAGGASQPGCWFHTSIADVDFFMLDSRYYRMKPNQPNPRMLGDAQMKWLLEKLKDSNATFKVIASPVPWAYGAKPGSKDPWQGYKAEREEIFSFLEANKIDGVLLISADRHRSDAWKIQRPNGYDLYEFESSKISNIHTHAVMKGSLFGYNAKCSFAKLSFDTTVQDPTITYRIINIDNELINTLTLKKSQISHQKPQ